MKQAIPIQKLTKKEATIEKQHKTARKILTAARAVFSEHGYNGTSMDEIAHRAAVNKATLYYQIGDKDTLYASVIHEVLGSISRNITQAVGYAQAPEEKLKAYIFCIAQTVDKNPEIPPIMMREIASGGANLPRVAIEDIASVIKILMSIMEEGTKKGVFIETVPFLLHMMILGAILFYKGSLPIKDRQTWLPAELRQQDKKIKGNIAEEVAKLVLRAVKK
ncbi:MAG: TetR/AcrR family transcriptional regulator [Smithellaceae bacterium]